MNRFLSRRSRRAVSTVETLITVAVVSAVTSLAMPVVLFAVKENDRNLTETNLIGTARNAVDETLYQMRMASTVYGSYTATNGTTYSSGTSQLVFNAPAYNSGNANYFLTGTYDTVYLWYDSATQKLKETLIPVSGSARPSRSNMTLVSNVTACTFTYKMRDQATVASGSQTITLSATPTGTPNVYVNGTATSSFTYSSSNKTVTLSLTGSSNDVQVTYAVNPTTDNTTMAKVSEIGVVLTVSKSDSRRITRTQTIQGAARLRNVRI